MERRELFKIIAAGAVAAPAIAQEHPLERVLDRIADIIIPSDEHSPGAHEAGVGKYLILAASLNPQRMHAWTHGVEVVEAESKSRFSKPFLECTRAQQEHLVELMARNEGQPQTDLERFFTSLKPAVVDGYRNSEIGVKQFMRWEGNHYEVSAWKGVCNHPEHQS
jgi:gluconate 2-dehydrogenase gamma chain